MAPVKRGRPAEHEAFEVEGVDGESSRLPSENSLEELSKRSEERFADINAKFDSVQQTLMGLMAQLATIVPASAPPPVPEAQGSGPEKIRIPPVKLPVNHKPAVPEVEEVEFLDTPSSGRPFTPFGDVPIAASGFHQETVRELEKLKKEMQQIGAAINTNGLPPVRSLVGRSPFTEEILAERLPPKMHLPALRRYDGEKDPVVHLDQFECQMTLIGASDAIRCKAFQTTLEAGGLQWFKSLEPSSVSSF